MSITTYAQLKDAIGHWIGYSDAATAGTLGITSTIDDLITIGETRLLREVKTKDNESSGFSTSIGSGTLSVPSDYIAMKYLYVNTTPTQFIEPRPPEWIYENYPYRVSAGIPAFFAREGTSFIFAPFPDSGYTVAGVYYKKLAALSTGTNNLFLNNPDLYLMACLAEASILIGPDSRIPLWEAKYVKIRDAVNLASQSSEYQGSGLRMRSGAPQYIPRR